MILSGKKKIFFGLGKTDVQSSLVFFGVWAQLCSIVTLSNTSAFNQYVFTAHESNWLKSIIEVRFKEEIFGGSFWGGSWRGGIPNKCQNICLLNVKKNFLPQVP